jgi:hypothetical protein
MSNAVTTLCRPIALPATQKAVLMALADFCHDDGSDWHGVTALMAWTCLGKTTVIDALKGLEARGLVRIERRFGATSKTFLQLDHLAADPANQCATRTGSGKSSRTNRNARRTGTAGEPVRVADATGAPPVQTGAPPVKTGAGGAPEALEALEASEKQGFVLSDATDRRKRKSGRVDMTAQIVEAYHAELHMLPRVKRPDANGRPRAIAKFWAVALERTANGDADRARERALRWCRRYFAQCAADDFITGKRAPGAGHEGWRADLDYVLRDATITRVIERAGARAQPSLGADE